MMRTKKSVAAASALPLMLVLAACGGSSTDAVPVSEPNQGLPTVGENVVYDPNKLVNDGEVIELEWWLWDGDAHFQAFVDAYEELHPNVDITIVNQPWDDYWTKLPLSLGDGSGPAIFNIHNSYHENLIGYMEPYDIPIDELSADYVGVEAHVIDDEVHYIDYGMMTGLVYYNTEMWAEAGLTEADIPETWDEFSEVAKQLTVRDGNSFRQAGFNYNGLFQEFTLGLPYQLGQNLMNPDMTTTALDNDATREVIQRFLDFYDVDEVGSKDFGPAGSDSFGQGQSAMVLNWGHFSGTLDQDFPDIEYGTFQTPVPEAGVEPYAFDRYNGESTPGISARASDEEKEVAQDFLRFFLTNAELLKELALNYSVYPMYVPLADDPEILAHPVMSAMATADRYVWPGPMPATFETSVTRMWEDILYNGVDVDTALAQAASQIDADLESSSFVSVEDLYAHYQPSN